jgi:gamma-glutamyl-gamma-aminobutyrate hydrolase PuuD
MAAEISQFDPSSLWRDRFKVEAEFDETIYRHGGILLGVLPTEPTMNYQKHHWLKGEKHDMVRVLEKCDGVILQGGLTEKLAYENLVVEYCVKHKVPLIGICAGFNAIVRSFGGTVHKDTTGKHNIQNRAPAHSVAIKPTSQLSEIIGQPEVMVNSIHEMVARDEEIKNLQIAAHSPDGLVEAVEIQRGGVFLLGVKWHPELLGDKHSDAIWRAFVTACKKR